MPLKRKPSQIKAVHQHCETHWAGKDKDASQPARNQALIKGHATLQVLVPSLFFLYDLSPRTCLALSVYFPFLPSFLLPLLLLPLFTSPSSFVCNVLHFQCGITDSVASVFLSGGNNVSWDVCGLTWSFSEPQHCLSFVQSLHSVIVPHTAQTVAVA